MCSDDFLTPEQKAYLRRGHRWRIAAVWMWTFACTAWTALIYAVGMQAGDGALAAVVLGLSWALFIAGGTIWCVKLVGLDLEENLAAMKATGVKLIFWPAAIATLSVPIGATFYWGGSWESGVVYLVSSFIFVEAWTRRQATLRRLERWG